MPFFSVQVDFPYLQKYRDEIQNGMAIVVEMPYKYGTLAEIKGRGSLCIQDFENEYTSGEVNFSFEILPTFVLAAMKPLALWQRFCSVWIRSQAF